jgi:hypothetical protein
MAQIMEVEARQVGRLRRQAGVAGAGEYRVAPD